MLLKPYHSRWPALHPTVRCGETVVLIGNVRCGRSVNIWYGAVLRGDADEITVGEACNIQDGCVLHCDRGAPVRIGRRCTLGHNAIVHGCTVGDETLIGMGATLLSGCRVGSGCIIGANALVTGGMDIPDGSLVMGVPAKVIRSLRPEEREHNRASAAEYLALAEEQLPLAAGSKSPARL